MTSPFPPRDDVQDIIDRFRAPLLLPSAASPSPSPTSPRASFSQPLVRTALSRAFPSAPQATAPTPSPNVLAVLKARLHLASFPTPRRPSHVPSTSSSSPPAVAAAVPPSQTIARHPSPSPSKPPPAIRLDPSTSPSHFVSALLAGQTSATAASPQRLQGLGDDALTAAASPTLSSPAPSPLPDRSGRAALHGLLLSTTGHSLTQLRSPGSKRSPQSSPDVGASAGSARGKPGRATARGSSTAGRHHRQLFTRAASSASALIPPSSSSAATTSAPPMRSSSTSSPARQRAAKEVQRAQLKAAAEAARRAAMAARLLIKLDPGEELREEKTATTAQSKRRKRLQQTESNGEEVRDVGAEELLRLSGVEANQQKGRRRRRVEDEESKGERVANSTKRRARLASAEGGEGDANVVSSKRPRKRKEGVGAVNGSAKKLRPPQRQSEAAQASAASVVYASDPSDGVGDTSDDSADEARQRFEAAVDDSRSEGTTGAEEEEDEEEEEEEVADARLRPPKPSSSSPFSSRLSNPLRSPSLLGASPLSSASFIAPPSSSRSSLAHRSLSALPLLGRLSSGQEQPAVVSMLTGGR